MLQAISEFWRKEDGQDLIEYSLLLAFLALAMAGLVSGSGTGTKHIFSAVGSALSVANTAAS